MASAVYYIKDNSSLQPIGGKIFYIDLRKVATDNFYVIDTTTGLSNDLAWSNTRMSTNEALVEDSIGSGKINSNKMLKICKDEPDTIWNWLYTKNTEQTNGCNDWYIGSESELILLKNSNLVDWFRDKYIWTSNEYFYQPKFKAVCWYCDSQYFRRVEKNSITKACLIRSF